MAIFLLVAMLLTPGITSLGQGSSHCMADCNMGQHGPSLYDQYCCQIGNYGKTLRLEEKGRKKIIFCPPTRPMSCPGNLNYIYSVICISLYGIAIVALLDCKSWYEAGNTTSGVYLINPDRGIPFEVSCSTSIFIFYYMSL